MLTPMMAPALATLGVRLVFDTLYSGKQKEPGIIPGSFDNGEFSLKRVSREGL